MKKLMRSLLNLFRGSLLIGISLLYHSTNAQVLASDSLALVDIYNSTNGAAWTTKTNWLTGNVNTWYGITVGGNRVTQVIIQNNHLTGSIPASIGNLTATTFFSLQGNLITGTIPSTIGSMTALVNLVLGDNQLTGNIPTEIQFLTNLTFLSLCGNQLTGAIPVQISNLVQLNYLLLCVNQLTGSVPPEIGLMTALTNVDLRSNMLSGTLPAEFGNLTNLSSLNLTFNQFTGSIPASFGNLVNLIDLQFQSNQLSGSIPPELGLLTNLLSLTLSQNNLTGSIPPQLGDLTSLTTLFLHNNQLSGTVPTELSNLTNIENLYLSNNQLEGAIPAGFSAFISLNQFEISNNNFDGLPDMSGNSPVVFNLQYNNFTFEDLEPNAFITNINYNPQKVAPGFPNQTIDVGAPINFSFFVGGANNTYQWYKNGSPIPGATTNTLNIPAATVADAGSYSLAVNNTVVTGLTINRSAGTVKIKSLAYFEWADGGDLTAEGYDSAGLTLVDSNQGGQWGDFNNDGYDDIYVSAITDNERPYIFKNNKNGTFTKLPNSAYPYDDNRGGVWGDYNNDGFADLFAGDYAFAADSTDDVSSVYRSNGAGNFLAIPVFTQAEAGAWFDYDNDRDLDLLVADALQNLVLLKNNGGDLFTPVTGLFQSGSTWHVTTVDYDNDGDMDVFMPSSNSAAGTRQLYKNNGDGTFTLESGSLLMTDLGNSIRNGAWADIDNDGDLDLYSMEGSAGENAIFINDGAGNFTKQLSSVILGEQVRGGRGCVFLDFDNDSYLDLLTFQMTTSSDWFLFHNNGDGTFTKDLTQTFRAAVAFGGASASDYNNDGFVDLFMTSFGLDYNGLYKNKGNSNNWIQIKLKGNLSNRDGIGSKISLYSSGLRGYRQVMTTNGFASQNSLVASFGLGTSTTVDSVVVQWPSGLKQKVTNLTINKKWNIKENNFEVDSLALVAFYNALGGPDWTNDTNWLTGPVTSWFGVTFTGGNVTSINLPGNNLIGDVPEEFANLIGLVNVNLSNNEISSIPDLTSLPDLTAMDVSGNMLDFSSLEINGSLAALNYGNQANLGTFTTTEVDVGNNFTVSVISGGVADQYQWKLNGTSVSGASQSSYEIVGINRSKMGDYICEITNPNVPGLVLVSAVQRVLAVANLSGRLLVSSTDPATIGSMSLFRVTSTGGYDTTAVKSVNPDGTYLIDKVVLDDYQLLGFADTLAHEGALPTYFEKTIFWEEADTLFVVDNVSDLDIISEFKPEPPKDGTGEISGVFSEDVPDGRILKNKRVSKAGCSLRRVEKTSRGKDVILTLIAYTFTNDDGEFSFKKLDPGEYRLNIQYPGYPMDTTSFINIAIGEGLFDKQAAVDAQVIDGKIVVRKLVVTGWEERDVNYEVYPNPTNDLIFIRDKSGLRNIGQAYIGVFNSQGKKLDLMDQYDAKTKTRSINMSNVPYGLYFLKIGNEGKTRTLKVVRSRQ